MFEPSRIVVAVLFSLLLSGCGGDDASHKQRETVRPYENLDELNAMIGGVPIDDFSGTGFEFKPDGVIEFRYFTYGRPEDNALIEPAIEKARQLTATLRKNHSFKLIFVDGDPALTIDEKPVGTGEVIRTVVLEKGS